MARENKTEDAQNEDSAEQDQESSPEEPGLRQQLELVLFLVVEVLCLLLFIDFLFIGFYVK